MNEVIIGDAAPTDASQIGQLLRQAFNPRYLLMSIYSSSAGDLHLERCLGSPQPGSPALRVRVACLSDSIVGCTIVSVREGKSHLEYIATSQARAPSGTGTRLLRDALATPGGNLTLDVFATNDLALAWYRRFGFVETERRPVQVINLRGLAGSEDPVLDATESISSAQEQERSFGFGELIIEQGANLYRFGLVGKTTLRVQEYPENNARTAALIAKAILPERQYLVLPVGHQASDLPVYFSDSLIRMKWQS